MRREDNREESILKKAKRADDLLSNSAFREWASSVMLDHGFFGEGREMSAFEQGKRSAIVRIFEEIAELSSFGTEFIAEVFGNLKKGK